MNLIEPQFIEKRRENDSPSDFESLVAQAVDLVQRLTGHSWTDFNIHDPGVTIIEQLCFAITDLSYRTEFPIEDLLTDVRGFIHRAQHAFFEKEQILTCNPVTVNDFRKVILDEMTELDNVMLVPITSAHCSEYMKGLYNILIRVNNHVAERFETEPGLIEEIKNKVVNHYLERRNLSEDLKRNITMLEPQKIQLHADIVIRYNIAPEEILVGIFNHVESLLNPKVCFYNEKELLDRGMKPDEIFCGPLLKNGFLPDSELKTIESSIDTIKLTNSISLVDGVIFVKNIRINDENQGSTGKPFLLEKNRFPFLDVPSFFRNVNLYTDEYKIRLKETVFLDLLNRTSHLRSQKRKTFMPAVNERTIRAGNYRNTGKYYSIQNNFPVTYGIGPDGLSPAESDKRKGAAKQLKAYLLLFEQVLANYLAQLENISRLYSTDISEANRHSYYYQPLYDVPGVKDLLSNYSGEKKEATTNTWSEFMANPQNGYLKGIGTAIETNEVYLERKNRIFDHLLARFNRKLNPFPAIQYFNTYIQGSNEERAAFLLHWKAAILDNLAKIDQDKIRAFNYQAPAPEISGFEYKIGMYLHLHTNRKNRRKLTSVFENGKIAFVSERLPNTFRPLDKEELVKTDWEGEEINLLTGTEEIVGLSEIGKVLAGGINQNQAYIFRNQGVSILKYGIHTENYKVGPSPDGKGEYIIIYKSPGEDKWRLISYHSGKKEAFLTLDKLIKYLQKISTDSEGFHLLEHLLLRPDIHLPAFGFRFCTSPGEVLFQNDQWTSFEDREIVLSQIKESADEKLTDDFPKNDTSDAPVFFRIKTSGSQIAWEQRSTEDFGKIALHESLGGLKIVSSELRKLNEDKTRMYPRFEMLVRLADGTIVPEDFYNLKVTILLPTWPARFQDIEFRTFVENLFRSLAPAYLRLQFRWLGVTAMKTFEELYFQWLSSYKVQTFSDETNKLSAEITAWLNENRSETKQ